VNTKPAQVAIATCLYAALGGAAAPVIGTVTAAGAFRIEKSTITGNATLMEGATIETQADASSIVLPGRARVTLFPDSKARFFGDRVILEKGAGRLERATGFRLETLGLTVQPGGGSAVARVTLVGTGKVQVAALNGQFRVLNARGLLVANVLPGKALDFEPLAASGPTKVTGYLLNRSGHWVLTDETTHVTVELEGPGLAAKVGQRVMVTGAMDPTVTPISDAAHFVRVAKIEAQNGAPPAGSGGQDTGAAGQPPTGTAPAGVGGASGTGGPAGAAARTGIGGTTIAIVAGVAVAAVVGGLAATGTLSGHHPNPISQ
jgi:hypothetical protein